MNYQDSVWVYICLILLCNCPKIPIKNFIPLESYDFDIILYYKYLLSLNLIFLFMLLTKYIASLDVS